MPVLVLPFDHCQIMTREEFNKLIDLYLSGQASPAEEKLINDFFDAQENKQTFSHYKLSEEMWASIEQSMRSRDQLAAGKQQRVSNNARSFATRKVLIPLFVILAIGAGFYFQATMSANSSRPWVTSESPKGQKSLIALADGSRVFLNSASSISYPETFDPTTREVKLIGEAFFEIARDEKKPFIVRSGDVVTRVLGTSFNIEAFEGESTRITVATGKVQVEVRPDSASNHPNRVKLIPGEQVVYHNKQVLISRSVDMEQVLAWKNQTLYFDNTTLEEVAEDLERWYNATIEFDNERIKNCRINGQYKEMDLRSVLESIRYMYPVTYKFSDQNHVVLYGKGCDQ